MSKAIITITGCTLVAAGISIWRYGFYLFGWGELDFRKIVGITAAGSFCLTVGGNLVDEGVRNDQL